METWSSICTYTCIKTYPIARVSIVKIISNAMGSVNEVNAFFVKMSVAFGKVANVVDKITFWN